MGIPLSVFGRKANLGEDTLDFFAAFVRCLVHMVDIQTLAVDPLRSQIAGEEVDHRIHEGGNFLGGVVGGQLMIQFLQFP